MNLIRESTNKRRIISYLKQLNEESFFKQLTSAIYSSLKEMFNNKEIEVKIDIFKYDSKKNKGPGLYPIHKVNVNGTFLSRKSSYFKVESNKTS